MAELNRLKQQEKTLPYILLNQFDARQSLHREVRQLLSQQFEDRLIPVAIDFDPDVSAALAHGTTIIDYAPTSPVTEDLYKLNQWLVGKSRNVPSLELTAAGQGVSSILSKAPRRLSKSTVFARVAVALAACAVLYLLATVPLEWKQQACLGVTLFCLAAILEQGIKFTGGDDFHFCVVDVFHRALRAFPIRRNLQLSILQLGRGACGRPVVRIYSVVRRNLRVRDSVSRCLSNHSAFKPPIGAAAG